MFLRALVDSWTTMTDTIGLAGASLVLDIIGVCLLFWTTSARRVETEIVFRTMSDFKIEENEEWVHPYSFEEYKQGLARTGQAISRNRRVSLLGLALIIVGFVLQLLDIVL